MKNLALKKRRLGPDQSHYNQSRFWSILHTTSPNYTDHPQVNIHWTHCIEYISYHSGFFSNSALALKNKVCPKIFHCIKYTFCIQDFLATCACAEKQESALNSLYWIYIFTVTCGEVRGWGGTLSFKAKFASIWIECE